MLKNSIAIVTIGFLSACTSYDKNDFGAATLPDEKISQNPICEGLPEAEKARCEEKQKKLSITLNSNNCKSDYEYQTNHCLKMRERKKQQLKESLDKHVKKPN